MDQDDSMLSTPSSHGNDDTYDEDSLFPAETTTTTTNPPADHLNASVPGELSPPRSADTTQVQATTSTEIGNGVIAADENSDDEGIDLSVPGNPKEPGSGWNNKKAQDEAMRSWEHIVDKDFDVTQFGDVLEDSNGKAKA